MIVGRQPHLGHLVSLMVLGAVEREIVRFKLGGVVCLSPGENQWLIEWAIMPELIHQ